MDKIISTFSQRKNSAIEEIRNLSGRIPAAVIVHELPKMEIRFMSEFGLKLLNKNWDEISTMPYEEFERQFLNEADSAEVTLKVRSLLESNEQEFVSYFQQVRTSPTLEWHWYLSVTQVLVRDDDDTPVLILTVAMQVDPAHYFTAKASRLLDENAFLKKNFEKFASLSVREKEVLRLLVLGKTAVEIGNALFISPATAETHRKKIYQKLGTNNMYNLTRYAQAFDLVKSSND